MADGTPERAHIRKALPEDEDAVFALAVDFATSFEVNRERFRESYATLLRDADCLPIVAERDGLVVGYLLAFVHGTFYANGPVGWIEEVTVRADLRRGSIGRALVDHAEHWLGSRGAALVGLATRRADDFWQAVGYETSARFLRKLLPEPSPPPSTSPE